MIEAQIAPKSGGKATTTLGLQIIRFAIIVAMSAVCVSLPQPARAQQQSTNSSPADQSASPNGSASATRGTKLILKDGTFQVVREYQVTGDRVRYYSLDRSDWEQIPASLVDWDATKKEANQTAQSDASLLNKVRHQEDQRRIMPLQIDASLEVAPGVFLPSDQGVFVFNSKKLQPVAPAEPDYKLNKGHEIERVMSPIPIVSQRHAVLLKGAHSKVRVAMGQLEFYVRIAPDQPPISLQLVKAEVDGETRKIARVDALFKMENATTHPLLMQRWQVAKDVYRFTLGQSLTPGEYALVQVIPGDTDLDQMTINVWDFGVDPSSTAEK